MMQQMVGQSQHQAALTSDAPAQPRNYPYNCWWVAALSEEVGRTMLSRWMLEMPILLYRLEDGTAVAMEDRCPHRSAPLSNGTLRGDTVVCGYHGFEFGADGKCTRVPTQANPGRIKARSYPVIEQFPFVWIYTGDLTCIDDVAKPMDSIIWGADPASVTVHGYYEVAANYMLIKENVLDISHVPVVHAKSLECEAITPTKVSVEGDIVTYRGQDEHGPLPLFHAMGSGLDTEKSYDQFLYGRFESPALQTSTTEFVDNAAPAADRKQFYSHICHVSTPIDMRSMHYWWLTGRNFGSDDAAFKTSYAAIVTGAFDEDKEILEAIQKVTDRAPATTEFSVAADVGPIEARRALQRWMSRET